MLSALNTPWRQLLPQAFRMISPPHAIIGGFPSSTDFYYLARGRLMIMHSDEDGHERVICYLGPDCLFNEAAAAAGFDAPNSPFICAQECVYYRFSKSYLHDPHFISTYPELMINLMNGLGIKVLIHHTSLEV